MSGLPTLDLIEDTAVLDLDVTDDNDLQVAVSEVHDGHKTIYSSYHSKDFFTSSQKVATIANRIEEQASESVSGEAVANEFRTVCADLTERESEGDLDEAFRTPTVDRLIGETESVKVFGGEPTTITVEFERSGSTRTIEFTDQEWTSNSAAKLRSQYYSCFFERIELGKDEWNDLVEYWQEQREIIGREEMTERDAIAEQVISGLAKRVTAVDDRSVLENDKYSAWYDIDNTSGDTHVTKAAEPNADVVWVTSAAVMEQLEEAGKNKSFLSQFSKTLRSIGATYTTSKPKSTSSEGQVRCYGFDPDTLGLTPDAIHSADDDGPEVEP